MRRAPTSYRIDLGPEGTGRTALASSPAAASPPAQRPGSYCEERTHGPESAVDDDWPFYEDPAEQRTVFVDPAALQARFDREAAMLQDELDRAAPVIPDDWPAGFALLAAMLPVVILATGLLPS